MDYRKEISVTGPNGTFHGFVVVQMNASKKHVTIHNRSTHDESDIYVNVHHVSGHAIGKQITQSSTEHEDKIPGIALNLENIVRSHLTLLSKKQESTMLETTLVNNGFVRQ